MMPRSLKARDLHRDPRCTVHSAVSDRMARDGEFKLHGRAVDVRDPKKRRRYPLFSIEIASAAFFINQDEQRTVQRWRVGDRLVEFVQGLEGGDEVTK